MFLCLILLFYLTFITFDFTISINYMMEVNMKTSHDNIGVRLGQILKIFLSGEHMSTAQLAQEFGVNVRTIQRDLHNRLSYLPLTKDSNQCYYLQEEALGKLGFKDIREFAKISGIGNLYPSLSDEFISDILLSRFQSNNLVNKYDRKLPFLIKNQGFSDSSLHYEIFKILSVAILKNKHVQFMYRDKERNAKPYRMLNNSGIWYLLAVENHVLKHFSLNFIKDIILLKESFKPSVEIEKLILKDNFVWTSQNVKEALLEVNIDSKEYFLRKSFVSSIKIIEENDDFFVISCNFSYDDELLNVVKMFLPHIKIISPIYLKDKLHKMLQDYIRQNK